MDLQSGAFLPFFLLALPIVLGIVDLMGIGKSTSAMTQGSSGAGALADRHRADHVPVRPAL